MQRIFLIGYMGAGKTTVGKALAKELGMKVIVTDHHGLPLTDSPGDAVLNPLLGSYPYRRLCGTGVAFKVAQALLGLEACREAYGAEWDDGEYYLVRDELESALPRFDVDCIPISFCADVMILSPAD